MMDLDNPKSDKELLSWLNGELSFLKKESDDRMREIKHNLARYKGIQYQSLDTRSGNRDRENERAKFSPKMVMNYLSNLTEQRTARLIKFKPVVQILPRHDEIKDKSAAKTAKSFLDYIQQMQSYEIRNMNVLKAAQICGEAYLDVLWDPHAGEVHPDWESEQEAGKGKKTPLLDDKGQPVLSDSGEPVTIDDIVKVGDVVYRVVLPLYRLFEKKLTYEEANYCFTLERKPVAELKKQYPKLSSQIKAEPGVKFYSTTKMEDEPLVNEALVVTFSHVNNQFMPKGRTVVFTKDVILENVPNKYKHGEFPFERMPCKILPDEQHAVSFFQSVKGPQAQYNNLTNAIIRNQMLVSHPKWFVPRGTVKLESLGNDITVVQYQGGVPPTLGQQNPTPAEVFNFRTSLRDEMATLAEVGDVLRGDPPAGITSGVALTFIAEQERQVANAEIVLYNEFVRRVAAKTLSVAGQNYDKSDKRTMMVLGKNSEWVKAEYDPEALASPFDIRIQNSSALPDSKAARMQAVLDFAKSFPNMFPQEQVVEMLDLGQSEKYLTEAASAARAAEAENEMILDGKKVGAPEVYEASWVHWQIHFKAMQDTSFKKMPLDRQEALKDHVLATEMLLMDQCKKSPALLQTMATNPYFPLFFTPEPPPVPPVDPAAMGMEPGAEPPMPGMEGMEGPPAGLMDGTVPEDAALTGLELPPEEQGPIPGSGDINPI